MTSFRQLALSRRILLTAGATAGLLVTAVLGIVAFIGSVHDLYYRELDGRPPESLTAFALEWLGRTAVWSVGITLLLYVVGRLACRLLWPFGKQYIAIVAITCGAFVWILAVAGICLGLSRM